jgi:hypothetical protein
MINAAWHAEVMSFVFPMKHSTLEATNSNSPQGAWHGRLWRMGGSSRVSEKKLSARIEIGRRLFRIAGRDVRDMISIQVVHLLPTKNHPGVPIS